MLVAPSRQQLVWVRVAGVLWHVPWTGLALPVVECSTRLCEESQTLIWVFWGFFAQIHGSVTYVNGVVLSFTRPLLPG